MRNLLKTNKWILVILAIFVSLVSACGNQDEAAVVSPTNATMPARSSSSSELCQLSGDIDNFKVVSKEEIDKISMGFMSSGKGIFLGDIEIEKSDDKTVKGSAVGHDKIEFSLLLSDGKKCNITVVKQNQRLLMKKKS